MNMPLLLKSNCVDVNAPIKRTYEISVKEESKTSKRKIEVLFSPFVVIFDIKKRQLLLSNGFDKNKKFQRLKHYNLDHTFNSVNSAYEYVDYYDQLKIERPIDENTNS